MTGASKILTVSYGTFSCTLEGFDDPFNTMKAIAEYFRDLAAEDRYFGAEPPVPDAAMLHRIAEREIHRRVEAKIQDNGVILRAEDTDEPVLRPDVPRPALIDAPVASADTTAESVAARLQRIRAKHIVSSDPIVSQDPVALQTAAVQTPASQSVAEVALVGIETHPAPADIYTEDEHAEDGAPRYEAAEQAVAYPSAQLDLTEPSDQFENLLDEAALIDLSDQFADLPADEDFATNLTSPLGDVEADYALDDAILAGLQSDLPEDTTVITQDAGELVDFPETFDVQDLDLSDIAAEAEDFASDDEFNDEDDMLAEAESNAAIVPATPADDAQFDDSMLARLIADEAVDADAGAADVTGRDDVLVEDAAFDSLEDEMLDRLAEADKTDLIENTDQIDLAGAAFAPSAQPLASAAPRARARVIRIRRAEPAAVTATESAALPTGESSALSDEAEAALQAELAALEAEINGDISLPNAASAVAEVETKPAEQRRHVQAPAEEEAVNRLIAQANSEMGGEDTRRRQSAIAHLKAAVAATEADRIINGSATPRNEEQMEAYRSDLDRVVRPRRPVSEAANTARAEPEASPARPTPLVLVSAQRIDRTPAAATAEPRTEPGAARVVMPVRPRRVGAPAAVIADTVAAEVAAEPMAAADFANADFTSADVAQVMQEPDQSDLEADEMLMADDAENVFADATSFEDFADQLGATRLSDLLEAAAVYCAEVLQRPEFSRPLVMRQIASLPSQSATSREDYLRGFGSLLRQGRITKVKRGMFALTDRSPYLAEARKIAG